MKYFGILPSFFLILLIACGGDDGGDSSSGATSGSSNSPFMLGALQNTANQVNSTAPLGIFSSVFSGRSAGINCTAPAVSTLPSYADLGIVWDSQCWLPSRSVPNDASRTITSMGYVTQELNNSISASYDNGPNVFSSIKSLLMVPCVITKALQPDQYDPTTGLPLPSTTTYKISITQELIDFAQQNCGGGIYNEDLGGTIDLDVTELAGASSATSNFYLRVELEIFLPADPAPHKELYFFGTKFSGNLNIGHNFNYNDPSNNQGYEMLIYNQQNVISYEGLEHVPGNGTYDSVEFRRGYIDGTSTFLVAQNNNGQKAIYTLSGNQANTSSISTKISLWSPYAQNQGGAPTGPNGGDNWGSPDIPPSGWTTSLFPYNGCIEYPAGDINGFPDGSCSNLAFLPVNDALLVNGKLPIWRSNIIFNGASWLTIHKDSNVLFTNPATTFTASPYGLP